ncbi:MAG: metal-sensitive transcriptional regulator [Anaerolineae bacterium]
MPQDHKQRVLSRLKSIEGHVRGVQRMVEEDKYCIDIIKQTLAIQRAIDKVNTLILGDHFNTCVTTAIGSQDPAERERVIGELLDVFDTTAKL